MSATGLPIPEGLREFPTLNGDSASLTILGGGRIASSDGEPEDPLSIRAGTILADGEDASEWEFDASGLYVAPGFIDLHAHVFDGQDLGVSMADFGPPHGVTTFVDAGSAGAHLMGAFERIARDAPTRCWAFVNISSIGTTSILLAGESEMLAYCDVDAAVAAVDRYRDFVVGIKVRGSGNVMGASAPEPVHRAIEAARKAQVPLMVHIGPPPPDINWLLSELRGGDILTHCFTGYDNRIVRRNGEVVEELAAARARGVLLDVGQGMGSLDSTVARAALEQGILPDAISTDLHAYALETGGPLDRLMTLFLGLGMPLADVVAAVTRAPARAIGHPELGMLDVDTPGDVCVFTVVDEPTQVRDPLGHAVECAQQIRVIATVVAGHLVYLSPEYRQRLRRR